MSDTTKDEKINQRRLHNKHAIDTRTVRQSKNCKKTKEQLKKKTRHPLLTDIRFPSPSGESAR